MKVGLIYDKIYEMHDTGPHVERIERVSETMKRLTNDGIANGSSDSFIIVKPREATLEQIKWCHSQSFIDKVSAAVKRAETTKGYTSIDADTTVCAQSMLASLYAVGGNFKAIDSIMSGEINNGFVLCRPPGHHSNRDHARGFCLFNNVALAAEYLLREKGIERVAIFDWDAHCGNGTQEIFWAGPSKGELMVFSLHEDPHYLYPGYGFVDEKGHGKQEGKIMNIPIAPYSSDASISKVMGEIVSSVLEKFKPQFILVSAGFDGHNSDPITQLGFTFETYVIMTRSLMDIAKKYSNNRVLITLEGGYNLEAISKSISNVFCTLAEKEPLYKEKADEEDPKIVQKNLKMIEEIKREFKEFWF